MGALEYEYLIRRVYNRRRTASHGANADIYRKLERAEMHLDDPNWSKTKDQKEYDYRSAFVEVREYIRQAIKEGLEMVRHKADQAEIASLESMASTLHRIDFYDKGKLDEFIDCSNILFHKYSLEP